MSTFFSILLAMLIAGGGAQCPQRYSLVGDKCLWFMTELKVNFTTAAEICDFEGGSLAKLDDCNLQADLVEFIESNDLNPYYWIGGTDNGDGQGTFIWTDGTEVPRGAPFWAPVGDGKPEPQNDDDNCAVLDPRDGFYFHNDNCSQEFSAICQLDVAENSPCPAPFISVAGGCYQFLDSTPVTWDVARSSCQDNGGDLAVIDDCSVMADIIGFIEGAGMNSSYFWIGGFKDASSLWVWIDGSAMAKGAPFWGFQQYAGLHPSGSTYQHCMIISTSREHYHFEDQSCKALFAPLCEAPLGAPV